MGGNYKQILKNFEQLVKEKRLKIGTPKFSVSYHSNENMDRDECYYDENHEYYDAIGASLKYIIHGPNGDIILFQELTLLVKKEAKSLIETIRSRSLQKKIKDHIGFFPLLSIVENHPDIPSLIAIMDGERFDIMSLTLSYNPTKWNDEGIGFQITPSGKIKKSPGWKELPVPSYAKGIFDKDPKNAFAMLLDFLCK